MHGEMQLYLRDALRADVQQIVGLVLNGKVTSDRDDPRFLADYLDAFDDIDGSDGTYLLVADLGGRIVGCLQLITFRHLQHRGGRCAEIESMHVAEDQRGRGIGSRLLEHAVRRADELGCYRVQLTSNLDRSDAHRFYERHHFVPSHKGYKRYLVRSAALAS